MPAFLPISPPKDPDDCPQWLYEVLKRLNRQLESNAQGLASVGRGEVPDGSGGPLPGSTVDLTDYFFLPGRSGGQEGHGGTAAGDDLTLSSTFSDTKGKIFLGDLAPRTTVDELLCRVGIGTDSPEATLHVNQPTTAEQLVPTTDGAWGNGIAFNYSGGTSRFDSLNEDQASPDEDSTYVVATTGASGLFWTYAGAIDPPLVGLANIDGATMYCRAKITGIASPGRFLKFFLTKSVSDPNTKIAERSIDINDLTGSYVTYTYTLTPAELADYKTSLAPHKLSMTLTDNLPSDIHITQLYMLVSTNLDIIRWDEAVDTKSGRIDNTGKLGIGTGATALAEMLTVVADSASVGVAKLKAAASQTADILQVRSSSDASLSGFTALGNPYLIADAAADATLVSDTAGVGSWGTLVSFDDEAVFYEDSPVYS